MPEDKTQKLAERIALLLQENEKGSDDFSALRLSIEKISERLDKIEAKLESANGSVPHSAFRIPHFNHPSQDRFAIEEAITDEISRVLGAEKACAFEPNGKPCDHCSMCSSRGF
jgi:seryl-tRNA synthetase